MDNENCIFYSFFTRILNKLTPDKFDKLSLELLNVGIDSPQILKGIILLVRHLKASGIEDCGC